MISLSILEEAARCATEQLLVIYLDHCSGTMVISFSGLGVIRAVSWWEHDEPNSSTFRSRGCFLGVQLSNMIVLVSDTPDDRENVTLSYRDMSTSTLVFVSQPLCHALQWYRNPSCLLNEWFA